MAAETVDTYTFTPDVRSEFSPENITGENKRGKAPNQTAEATGKPMEVKPVSA